MGPENEVSSVVDNIENIGQDDNDKSVRISSDFDHDLMYNNGFQKHHHHHHCDDDFEDRYGTPEPVMAAIATTIKIGHLNDQRRYQNNCRKEEGEKIFQSRSMSRKDEKPIHSNGFHLNGVKQRQQASITTVTSNGESLYQTITNGNGYKNANVHYQNGVGGAKNGFFKCNHHHDPHCNHFLNDGGQHCRKVSSSQAFIVQEDEDNHHDYGHQKRIDDGKSSSSLDNNHVSDDVSENKKEKFNNHYERTPFLIAIICYFSYFVLILFGYLRDFMRKTGLEKNLAAVERDREGFTPLYKSFDSFYTRNIYRRISDCFNRPISSVPGAEIDIVDRISNDGNWTFQYPGTTTRVINMGSYNYLGYAENKGPIHQKILETVGKFGGGSICSTRNEMGISEHVLHLERLMARFLGVEACIVFGMGFATNSTNIQCFVESGCLIMSDEHNHSSLILGCRLSGATTKIFKHNDMEDLERKIRQQIVNGQPKTGRPWKKIFIIVEGIYSMEGTIVDLPGLLRIKKLYNCYIYLDEAHSIGALGPKARGVIDYFGCDPNDVDILMGTFTKSFGAAGGYIAGSRALVDTIRINSFSHYYANPMSSPIAQQIISVVESLLGEDGTDEGAKRIERLARNSRYFRRRLQQMGFIIYGPDDSPVVPLLLVFCSKISAVLRMAHERGLGFIGAGYPATTLTSGRVRFCISAAHTKEMLDRSLDVMNEIGDKLQIKYSRRPLPIIGEKNELQRTTKTETKNGHY